MKNLILSILCFTLAPFIQCTSNKVENNNQSKFDNNLDLERDEKENRLLAPVQGVDGWFFINEKGEKAIDQNFNLATKFREGISCVESNASNHNSQTNSNFRYYGINKKGERIANLESDYVFYFKENRAFIQQGSKTLLVDTSGKIIKETQEKIYPNWYTDGISSVFLADKGIVQLWDQEGKVIQDNLVKSFFYNEGLMVYDQGLLSGYMDVKGNVAQEAKYTFAGMFEYGLAKVEVYEDAYFIDKNFAYVIGPYQRVEVFSDDVAAVQEDDLWFYIDRDGKQIIAEKFLKANKFSEGLAVVIKLDNTLGLIKKDGTYIPLDPGVSKVYTFENGYAGCVMNGLEGFLNTKGELAIPAKYYDVKSFN